MPTSLPIKLRRKPDLFSLFVIALACAFLVIEIADPATMSVEAAQMSAP